MTKKSRFGYAVDVIKQAEPEEIKMPEVLADDKQKATKSTPAKRPAKPVQAQTALPTVGAPKADLAVAAQAALQNPSAFALPPQRRGWRGAKPGEEEVVKRMDVPREQLNVRVRPELKRAAAARAALSGLTLGDVVEAALIAYLDAANK